MESKTTKPQLFKPGQGGRPKGAANKVTVEQKKRVEWVLDLLDETLEEDVKALKAKDKVELWVTMQEYIRPKLQRMNLDVGAEDKEIRQITFKVIRSGDPVKAAPGDSPNPE